MSDLTPTSDGQCRQELDRLRRLLAAADSDHKMEIVEDWSREQSAPEKSDDVAHTAITVRDIAREIRRAVESEVESKVERERAPTNVGKKLVIVVHGIRDHAVWLEMVRSRLSSPTVFVQPVDFEWHTSGRFITGRGTAAAKKEILDKIRDAQRVHLNSELIIIAHSFGTYLVSEILLKEPDVECSRMIFCGAVVSRKFPFRLLTQKPQIINECGDRDIYPVLAQGYSLWNRYSASGVWGLRRPRIHDRFHDFKHSDYLKRDFVDEFWKPFIDNNEVKETSHESNRRDVPWGVSVVALGWRAVWGVMLTIGIFVAAIVVGRMGAPFIGFSVAAIIIALWGCLTYKVVTGIREFHHPLDPKTVSNMNQG